MSWCVGEYDGALKDCIQALKFVRNKEAAKDLAALLDDTIPELPLGTIVTFVPTISSHRRQRGYDHAKLIAKRFARTRKLRFNKVLNRLDNSRQLGASAKQRWSNARTAYAGYKVEQATYLLIDDVMTSGATLECASKVLKDAGANAVWVACLARQTLD